MNIIAISGKKQSGKTTTGNFLMSLFLSNMGISKDIRLDESGEIQLSDIYGNTSYTRIAPRHKFKNDFVVSGLYDKLDQNIKIYNFADTLKQTICMDILGMSYNQCYGSDEDKNTMTNLEWDGEKLSARKAMQVIGTDIFRKLNKNVWINKTISLIQEQEPGLAVITDCRFPDEVDSVKRAGGYVVRLTRDPYQSQHISETALDKENYDWGNFSHIIDNEHMTVYEQCLDIQNWISTLRI
jgi:hypothetical protein